MAKKVTMEIGPITAPAQILTAVREEKDGDLKTVCQGEGDKKHAATRVNSVYRCSGCGREESSYHPFPRGRAKLDGTFTVLTKEQLAEAEASTDAKTKLALLPAPRDQVERLTVPNGNFYYVGPRENPAYYKLLRDIMLMTSDRYTWVTEWAPSTAASLVRVQFVGDVLALQQLARPSEMVAPPLLDLPDYKPAFLEMALGLVDSMRIEFEPTTFTNTRKRKIAEMLAQAGAGSVESVVSTLVDPAQALFADLQKWADERGLSVGGKQEAEAKPAARKRAPRKTKEKVSA